MTRILKDTEELGIFQKNFKAKVMLNYLNKIHLPILYSQALVAHQRDMCQEILRTYFTKMVRENEKKILEKELPH